MVETWNDKSFHLPKLISLKMCANKLMACGAEDKNAKVTIESMLSCITITLNFENLTKLTTSACMAD